VSKNLNPPIFPVAAPGIRLRANPTKFFYAQAALFSGDVGEPSTTNKHNTRFSFPSEDGALLFAEIGYALNPKEDTSTPSIEPAGSPSSPPSASPSHDLTLSGTYKLSGFYDSGRFADNAGDSSHRGNFSIYFVVNQDLWHLGGQADRTLSFFTRFGGAPADRNSVQSYLDGGFNWKGLLPNRTRDTLGVGVSFTRLSDDLTDPSGRPYSEHYETVVELTYQAAFGDHLSIQPDLQCIINPGATAPAATALIGGVRLNVKF
jgi:porin